MAENKEKLVFDVAYQPQVRAPRDTKSIMLDVMIALLPALAVSVWQFGFKQLLIVAVSVASAVFYEWLYRKILKKSCAIGDLSACVTGMLLAMTLPMNSPWWLPLIGNLFAIVVVKQLYGGIGKNFVNPALAGRAFLLASYTNLMGTWAVPKALTGQIDAVSMATPLSCLYGDGAMPAYYTAKSMFLGMIPGCIGEISTAALLAGFAYLLIRRVISWRIPVSFIGTVALLTLIFGHSGFGHADWMVYNLLSGSLILGAVFMATDYATSPVTMNGQLVYGFGCGALTVLIRYFGGFPEGVTYAILIMNLCSWALDKAFHRHQFGVNPSALNMIDKAGRFEEKARKLREKAQGGYKK